MICPLCLNDNKMQNFSSVCQNCFDHFANDMSIRCKKCNKLLITRAKMYEIDFWSQIREYLIEHKVKIRKSGFYCSDCNCEIRRWNVLEVEKVDFLLGISE